eukprot:16441600-Heterocapsa_arctica.AAC.1
MQRVGAPVTLTVQGLDGTTFSFPLDHCCPGTLPCSEGPALLQASCSPQALRSFVRHCNAVSAQGFGRLDSDKRPAQPVGGCGAVLSTKAASTSTKGRGGLR